MAGLLDLFNAPQVPGYQGQLGLLSPAAILGSALLQASGPSKTPTSLGQALGAGFQNIGQQQMQTQQLMRQANQDALQKKQIEANIANQAAQLGIAQTQLGFQKDDRARQQAAIDQITQIYGTPGSSRGVPYANVPGTGLLGGQLSQSQAQAQMLPALLKINPSAAIGLLAKQDDYSAPKAVKLPDGKSALVQVNNRTGAVRQIQGVFPTGGEADKAPSGFAWNTPGDPNSGLKAIPGGPATRFTGDTAKLLGYTDEGLRFIKDFKGLTQPEIKDKDTGAIIQKAGPVTGIGKQWNLGVAGAGWLAPNLLRSPLNQKIEFLQKNLSDVITRMRTGAALNDSEVEHYLKLIPRFGDSDETIQYKLNEFEKGFRQLQNNIRPQSNNASGGEYELTYDPKSGAYQ